MPIALLEPAAGGTPSLRTVTTDNGPLDIPASPKRVVAAIGSFETDMVAVGVMPAREGEALVASFERRLDDLRARRSGEPATSVARIALYEAGSFSYRGQHEDTAELMRAIGLTVVGPDDTVNDESLERLPEIDADWLVVPVGDDSIPHSLYDEVAATEVFQAIPAVQAGRVHLVVADLWPGLGYLWAQALVDDLERLFVSA